MSLQKPPRFTDPPNFSPVILLQRAKLSSSLRRVWKGLFPHISSGPWTPGLWPLLPNVNSPLLHPSQSSGPKGPWSQPVLGTAGCKWEEEGAARKCAPRPGPPLHSVASGLAKRDLSRQPRLAEPRTAAFFSKTDSDLACCGCCLSA